MVQKVLEDIFIHRTNGFKIKVNNEQESIAVQNELFKIGFTWGLCGQTIQNTRNHFMYCRIGITSKIISVERGGERWFNNSNLEEYTVDDIVGVNYVEYFYYKNRY